MGTPSPDKSSKKRKRSHVGDESLTEEYKSNHEKITKKKRKSQQLDESVQEEQHASSPDKSPKKKKKSQNKNESLHEEKLPNSDGSSKKKRQIKDHSILEQNDSNINKSSKKRKRTQEENHGLSKKAKNKSNGVAKGAETPEDDKLSGEGGDDCSSDERPPQPKKKGKTKGKKPNSSGEEEGDGESEKEEKPQKKKGNKKGKEFSSFGVVDANLLREHGGEAVKGKERVKNRKPNQINRALAYLHLWKNNFKAWKFSTLYQVRLMKNLYNTAISEQDFEICLQYFEKCKGKAKEQLKADAMAYVAEDGDESVDAEAEKRARQVLQMFG